MLKAGIDEADLIFFNDNIQKKKKYPSKNEQDFG
jgi:hypothetical protein